MLRANLSVSGLSVGELKLEDRDWRVEIGDLGIGLGEEG